MNILKLFLTSISITASLLFYTVQVLAIDSIPTPKSLELLAESTDESPPTPASLLAPLPPQSTASLVVPTPPSLQQLDSKPNESAGSQAHRSSAKRSHIFKGGSNSLVARTVGHAEGTRTATGGRTRAYHGHKDPGNDVRNLGSFSFQHCREARYNCSTPDQADRHQLRRLQRQAQEIRQRAAALGMSMSLEEELNAIDLVNQSPRAALARKKAYPERLAQAKNKGLQGQQAILSGRVWAYWDDSRGRWAAPGLWRNRKPGETYKQSITRDQWRRLQAIAKVLSQYPETSTQQTEQRVDEILAQ
jgi:hypothetical protein